MNHDNDNGKPLTSDKKLTFISMFSGIEAASVAFKPLGNSWAVPKFTWLGRRIQECMPPPKEQQALAA